RTSAGFGRLGAPQACGDAGSGGGAGRHRGGRRVTGLKRTTEKNLMLFSGRAHPHLAEEISELLETDLVPTTHREFANSEIYVRYQESVRGCDAFVIQSHTAPVNEWIMEQLIMVDALKRASAKR